MLPRTFSQSQRNVESCAEEGNATDCAPDGAFPLSLKAEKKVNFEGDAEFGTCSTSTGLGSTGVSTWAGTSFASSSTADFSPRADDTSWAVNNMSPISDETEDEPIERTIGDDASECTFSEETRAGAPDADAASVLSTGEVGLPSVGSALHAMGGCRPCAWFYKKQGCVNGKDCRHCHLCQRARSERAKKVKVATMKCTADVEESAVVIGDTPFSPQPEPAVEATPALEDEDDADFRPPPGLGLPEVADRQPTSPDDSSSLPSVGSSLHGTGECRPCAWFYKAQGCANGKECRHCHLCDVGEIKLRKKVKTAALKKVFERDAVSDEEDVQKQPKHLTQPLPLTLPYPATYDMSPMTAPPFHAATIPYTPMPIFLPSLGSSLHGTGRCRPCAWFWKPQGCANGHECFHCHFCPAGEIRDRKKVKLAMMRVAGGATAPSEQEFAKSDASDIPVTVSVPLSIVPGTPPTCFSSPRRVGFDAQMAEVADDTRKVVETEEHDDEVTASEMGQDEDSDAQQSTTAEDSVPMSPMSVPLPESFDLPSTGSALHLVGKCRPCAWFYKSQGCLNSRACAHCHICPEGELRQRRKAKVVAMRMGALVPTARADSARGTSQPEGAKAPRVVKIAPMI